MLICWRDLSIYGFQKEKGPVTWVAMRKGGTLFVKSTSLELRLMKCYCLLPARRRVVFWFLQTFERFPLMILISPPLFCTVMSGWPIDRGTNPPSKTPRQLKTTPQSESGLQSLSPCNNPVLQEDDWIHPQDRTASQESFHPYRERLLGSSLKVSEVLSLWHVAIGIAWKILTLSWRGKWRLAAFPLRLEIDPKWGSSDF